MRKEIAVAIVAGIILGLLIAFGSWRANLAMNKEAAIANQVDETPLNDDNSDQSPKEIAPTHFTIALSNIDDYDVLQENPLKLTGITKAGSILAISGETEDYIVKTNSDGSFSQEIRVVDGVNQILMTAYTETNEKVSKKLTIVYTDPE